MEKISSSPNPDWVPTPVMSNKSSLMMMRELEDDILSGDAAFLVSHELMYLLLAGLQLWATIYMCDKRCQLAPINKMGWCPTFYGLKTTDVMRYALHNVISVFCLGSICHWSLLPASFLENIGIQMVFHFWKFRNHARSISKLVIARILWLMPVYSLEHHNYEKTT